MLWGPVRTSPDPAVPAAGDRVRRKASRSGDSDGRETDAALEAVRGRGVATGRPRTASATRQANAGVAHGWSTGRARPTQGRADGRAGEEHPQDRPCPLDPCVLPSRTRSRTSAILRSRVPKCVTPRRSSTPGPVCCGGCPGTRTPGSLGRTATFALVGTPEELLARDAARACERASRAPS